MRLPWSKSKVDQLELLEADPDIPAPRDRRTLQEGTLTRSTLPATPAAGGAQGHPLLVPSDRLYEDPNNPRTEFPNAELDELADDIRRQGILQPLVVHPADEQGRHRIHFGAKRWRAARRAGLGEVPVVLREAPSDPYTQVAENQKRHGLTSLDLARFFRARADAGDSNATIAKRIGIDQTTIAHHLALLDLPPVLNEAMQAGRCTSPRALYELNRLHHDEPERVRALLAGDTEITRCAVNAARTKPVLTGKEPDHRDARCLMLAQADAACERLERALYRLAKAKPYVAGDDLALLKQRVASLVARFAEGSDGPTPTRPT